MRNILKKRKYAPEQQGMSPAADRRIAMAEFLKSSPEAMQQFEKVYREQVLSTEDTENFFQTNSRQAAEMRRIIDTGNLADPSVSLADPSVSDPGYLANLVDRIVAELVADTPIYTYDGVSGSYAQFPALLESTPPVTNEDLKKVPLNMRPELAGGLMKVDFPDPSYPNVLSALAQFVSGETETDRIAGYNLFRQGLDILDLDDVLYEIIGTNKNSMGFWLPKLVDAATGTGFFQIPKTTVARVPLPMLQLTRVDCANLTTIQIVDRWAQKVFALSEQKNYFIKTGTYSSKFDFRNAKVTGAKEVRELGEYLLFIHHQALQMASSLASPCIYGASTTNEWVVREFIEDKENNPTIYKGLPLHTEYRVFVDCDTDKVIGIAPYWEPETMLTRFGSMADADDPHNIHDFIVYKSHEGTLMRRFKENAEQVTREIEKILPALDLPGQWSIDVMQNGDDFWIIDMAAAASSAFFEKYVPDALKAAPPPGWLPGLPKGIDDVIVPKSAFALIAGEKGTPAE